MRARTGIVASAHSMRTFPLSASAMSLTSPRAISVVMSYSLRNEVRFDFRNYDSRDLSQPGIPFAERLRGGPPQATDAEIFHSKARHDGAIDERGAEIVQLMR